MGTEDGKGAYPEHGHHQHRHSDTDIIGADRTAYSGPLSGPLNKRGGRKSALFNLPDSAGGSAGGDDDQAYVEITLDVRDDSVAVHSVRAAGGGEIEDPELTLLAKGLEKRSSFRASAVVRNASSRIKQVSQELKRFASFSKKSNQAGRFDRNKSAAAHALKGLKFISKTDGGTGWAAVEKRFDDLTAGVPGGGLLPRSLFGECIGMNKDSKEFAGELFDALYRRRNIPGDSITKSQLREFWDQISDQSFDSRLQTFFDMVDKDADEKGRERIRQKHSRSERARGATGNIVALKKKTKLDEGFAFDALQTLADLSLLNRRCIACFLESREIIEDALEVAIEPDYRFELAL